MVFLQWVHMDVCACACETWILICDFVKPGLNQPTDRQTRTHRRTRNLIDKLRTRSSVQHSLWTPLRFLFSSLPVVCARRGNKLRMEPMHSQIFQQRQSKCRFQFPGFVLGFCVSVCHASTCARARAYEKVTHKRVHARFRVRKTMAGYAGISSSGHGQVRIRLHTANSKLHFA